MTGQARKALRAIIALSTATLWLAAIYVIAALYGNGGARAEQIQTAPAALKGLNTGHMAAFLVHKEAKDLPEFTFKSKDGRERTIEDWKGRVVLLNLWATWCGPCRREMPALDKLETDLGGGDFEVVAISIDRSGFDKPAKFLDELGIKSLKLYGDKTARISVSLRAIGMPTTLLIDRNGKEIGRLIGPAEWDSPEAVKLIKAAIGAAS